jgi:hypothetical protein
MSQTEQETAERVPAEQVPVRRLSAAEERSVPPTDTTASDNWKLENENFRRMLRTGEFAVEQTEQPPEAPEQPEAPEPQRAA